MSEATWLRAMRQLIDVLTLVTAMNLTGVRVDAAAGAERAAAVVERYGFVPGAILSLDLTDDLIPGVSARSQACGDCHGTQYSEWMQSRHAVAWSNEVFQQGYRLEPQPMCVHCHAPLLPLDRPAATPTGPSQAADSPLVVPPALGQDFAHEGIGCAACHVRQGRVITGAAAGLASAAALYAPHATEEWEDFGTPEFCSSCHQFNFPRGVDGSTIVTGQPMQNTFGEWLTYAADTVRPKTCTGCHMPNGSHRFPGSHDLDFLRASIALEQIVDNGRRFARLRSQGVGHNLPTGDLFRHMTLEARGRESSFMTVHRLGKVWDLPSDILEHGKIDDTVGGPGQGMGMRLVEDTTLAPGETRLVEIPADAVELRLRYHYALAEHELIGDVAQSLLVKTIWRIAVQPSSH